MYSLSYLHESGSPDQVRKKKLDSLNNVSYVKAGSLRLRDTCRRKERRPHWIATKTDLSLSPPSERHPERELYNNINHWTVSFNIMYQNALLFSVLEIESNQ